MKKSRKKSSPKAATSRQRATARPEAAGTPTADQSPSRRSFIRLARNGAIAAAVLAGGGWFAVGQVQAHYTRRDLTVIGNGIPTVVQIHDPTCPICTQLQKEMLQAAKAFSDEELQVRIAPISTAEGRSLAAQHGVSHATLLLFDGSGRVRRVLTGPNDRESLETSFKAHIARNTRSTS